MLRTIAAAAAILLATAVGARAGGPPVAHHHHGPACGHGAGCGGGHTHCGHYPCAQFTRTECKPLPPITLSRYADNGEYDCTRRYFGDARPHCPGYWFDGQPYAYSHDYQSGGSGGGGGGGGGGVTGGRGIGISGGQ